MSFNNDWDNSVPIDHTKFKNLPGEVRDVRIDLEDRLNTILSGFVSGETIQGIKLGKFITVGTGNASTPDGTGSAATLDVFVKTVDGGEELCLVNSSGNVLQFTTDAATKIVADEVGGYGVSTTAVESKIPIMGASGYLPDNSVDTTALKTTSGAVSSASAGNQTLPGGAYGFYPQTKVDGGTTSAIYVSYNATNTSYVTTIGFLPQGSVTCYAQQYYVTASGKDFWIFLLINKVTRDILSSYAAPDHPAYGNGGDFNELPHPFLSYDETKHEVVLVDNSSVSQLKSKTTRKKGILELINEDYKIDDKEEKYSPLHSGQFMGEKPVMVEKIPEYIKVRKLIKK